MSDASGSSSNQVNAWSKLAVWSEVYVGGSGKKRSSEVRWTVKPHVTVNSYLGYGDSSADVRVADFEKWHSATWVWDSGVFERDRVSSRTGTTTADLLKVRPKSNYGLGAATQLIGPTDCPREVAPGPVDPPRRYRQRTASDILVARARAVGLAALRWLASLSASVRVSHARNEPQITIVETPIEPMAPCAASFA